MSDLLGIDPLKSAYQKFVKVSRHPTCYGCIKHHKYIVSGYTGIAHPMLFLPFLLEYIKRSCNTFLAGSPYCKLHSNNRQSK